MENLINWFELNKIVSFSILDSGNNKVGGSIEETIENAIEVFQEHYQTLENGRYTIKGYTGAKSSQSLTVKKFSIGETTNGRFTSSTKNQNDDMDAQAILEAYEKGKRAAMLETRLEKLEKKIDFIIEILTEDKDNDGQPDLLDGITDKLDTFNKAKNLLQDF